MKKILIVCRNGDSPFTGFATRVRLIANTLSENGFKVTLLRIYPAFHPPSTWRKELQTTNIELLEIPMVPASRIHFFKPLAAFLSSLIIHLLSILKKADLIQAEAHEAGHPALLYNLSGIPIVVDFHGAVPEEARERSRQRNNHRERHHWLEKMERLCVQKSDAIFVVSPKMIEHLNRKHETDITTKSYLVPVNVSESFAQQTNRLETRSELGFVPEDIVYTYSGGAQEYQCIHKTLEIFSEIHNLDPRAKLLILTGDKQYFENIINNSFQELARVSSLFSLKSDEVYRYLNAADIAFLLREDRILNSVSCPTKFGEYLAAGIPVISTEHAGHAPIYIKKYEIGLVICLQKYNSAEIVQFSHNITSEMKQRCEKVIESDLNWNTSAIQIFNCYEQILKDSNALSDGSSRSRSRISRPPEVSK